MRYKLCIINSIIIIVIIRWLSNGCRLSTIRLRSTSTAVLIVPRSKHNTIGDLPFPIAAAKVWNTLPLEVTSAPSLPSIKRRLKTELFAIHPSVSNNYRVMVLPVSALLRDLEALCLTIVAFRSYLFTTHVKILGTSFNIQYLCVN